MSRRVLCQKIGGENPIPVGNIVSYWKMENNVLDSVGTKDGTPTNITYAAGQVGQAAVFNGTTSKIIIPSDALPADEFTVSVWIKLNSTTGEQRFFAFNNNTGSAHTIIRFNVGGVANRISTYVFNSDGASLADIDGYTLSNWTNVILSAKRLTNVKTYVNGVLKVTDDTVGNLAQAAIVSNCIGANRGGTGLFFNGLGCEAANFNIQVTDEEALAIYNKGNAGLPLI